MKTYHEIFVSPDGEWSARVYQADAVAVELSGRAIGSDAAKQEATRAVAAWKEQAGVAVAPAPIVAMAPAIVDAPVKRAWWRFWK